MPRLKLACVAMVLEGAQRDTLLPYAQGWNGMQALHELVRPDFCLSTCPACASLNVSMDHTSAGSVVGMFTQQCMGNGSDAIIFTH